MKLAHSIYTIFLAVFITSCVDEFHFGKSERNFITAFSVPGQIGQTIFEDSKIYVAVDPDYDLSMVYPTIAISNFSSLSPNPADGLNFNTAVEFSVKSESGNVKVYKVWLYKTTPEVQLPNSDFQVWYSTKSSNKQYLQIGSSLKDTIWATSNAGSVSIASANVMPAVAGLDTIAELNTINTGKLAQAIGQGIAAGSLFSGTFKLNLTNPVASARMGTPFVGRPKSFSVDYKYTPGAVMMNGKGATLTSKDSLDIYLLLEDRSSTPIKRIATAWYRSGNAQEDFTELKLNLTYGPISSPQYYERPKTGSEWGTGNEKPTHITVVFSSSARGDLFEGAPGSKLTINNFALQY